jgi:hypothetical protein
MSKCPVFWSSSHVCLKEGSHKSRTFTHIPCIASTPNPNRLYLEGGLGLGLGLGFGFGFGLGLGLGFGLGLGLGSLGAA